MMALKSFLIDRHPLPSSIVPKSPGETLRPVWASSIQVSKAIGSLLLKRVVAVVRLLSFGLLMLAGACTAAPSASATPTITPTTATSTPVAAATLPQAVPTHPPVTRIIVRQATPLPTMVALFVNPTPAATQAARIGWRTFVHPGLHLAVNYPPEWTVRFQDNAATFTSPEGITIDLMPIDPRLAGPNEELASPNTRCTNSTNPYGIDVRTCRATIGFSLDAYLDLKPENAAETAAVISTRSSAALEVFNALIESARIAP
jgi:hypothetical protein